MLLLKSILLTLVFFGVGSAAYLLTQLRGSVSTGTTALTALTVRSPVYWLSLLLTFFLVYGVLRALQPGKV